MYAREANLMFLKTTRICGTFPWKSLRGLRKSATFAPAKTENHPLPMKSQRLAKASPVAQKKAIFERFT